MNMNCIGNFVLNNVAFANLQNNGANNVDIGIGVNNKAKNAANFQG